jgi:hypothetical protein
MDQLNIADVVSQSLGSLEALRSALMGGDTTADAIAEKRCIKEPAGCGKSLLNEDGTPRFNFDDRDQRDLYMREWTISGMCPECWDRMVAANTEEEGEEEPVASHFPKDSPMHCEHEGVDCAWTKYQTEQAEGCRE